MATLKTIVNFYFKKKIFFFAFFPWKLVKVYWLASQTWQHFLTHAKHFEGECSSVQVVYIKLFFVFVLFILEWANDLLFMAPFIGNQYVVL